MAVKARQWVVPHVVDFDPQLREAFLTIEDYLATLDAEIGEGGGGGPGPDPTDHGVLTGLGDDDHPQYLRNSEIHPGTNVTVLPQADGTVIISSIDTGAKTLNDLTDVDTVATPPVNTNALRFDGPSGLWLPRPVAEVRVINDITDVDTGSRVPQNADVLTWDATSSQWRPAAVTTGGGLELGPEVVTTDGSGVGLLYYGPNVPTGPQASALWLTTRLSADVAPPTESPVTQTPVLTVTTPVTTTVTITWTAAANATSYEIFVGGVSTKSVSGTLTTTLVLPESSTSQITVRGVNSLGPGPTSTQKPAVVPNQTPPPVTNLALSSSARGSLTFAWTYTPPADFSVYVVTANAGTVTIDAANKSATVSGLGDSVTATVSVSARDTGSLTSSVVQANGTTPAAPPPVAPDTPTGLHPSRIGYSSADIVANGVAGATSYEVSGDGVNWGSIGLTTVFNWTGLAESTTYTLQMRAVGPGGASAPASTTFTTLPKVAYYNPTTADRTVGYGQEPWGNMGIGYDASGRLYTTDHWASGGANSYAYALDGNTNTGPYATDSDRWIRFSTSWDVQTIFYVQLWMGYPGVWRWAAYNTSGVVVQQGGVVASVAPQIITPNEINAPSGSLTRIQIAMAAGGGSPGVFKLREWAIACRVVTGYTPVYNPA